MFDPMSRIWHSCLRLFSRFGSTSSPAKSASEPASKKEDEKEIEALWSSFRNQLRNKVLAYVWSPVPEAYVSQGPLWFLKHRRLAEYEETVLPARYFLGIPATQASTERANSAAESHNLKSCGHMEAGEMGRLVSLKINLPSIRLFRERKKVL